MILKMMFIINITWTTRGPSFTKLERSCLDLEIGEFT